MKFALKMAKKLFAEESEQQRFIESLQSDGINTRAIVWTKKRPEESPFQTLPRFEWQPASVDIVASESRPGAHPLHDAGYYYCLDSSSVFAASVFCGLAKNPERVIDVCAAPGGKSVIAAMELQPTEIICNETIGKRIAALSGNLTRCEIAGAVVNKNDPAVLAEKFSASADLVIVDAPCSGQSLLVKGKPVPGAFHPNNINMNSNRQKRIIANAATLVRTGGFLAYMTCTFSFEENENVLEWFLKRFPQFVPVASSPLAAFQSSLVSFPCYRLWPFSGIGAGSFTSLLQRVS